MFESWKQLSQKDECHAIICARGTSRLTLSSFVIHALGYLRDVINILLLNLVS